MKLIKLTQNKYTIVDDEDFDYLSQWRWQVSWNGYVIRRYKKTIRMHRLINKTPDGLFTDHINRNKLDNRKSNLRTVTKSENGFNTNLSKNNKSGCKGVYWDGFTNKWRAEIKLNYKKISLGRYVNLIDAVSARKEGEEKYHAI
jgi:HNH endonuclease